MRGWAAEKISSSSPAPPEAWQPRRSPSKSDRLLVVLLVLGACLPYLNTLFNGFVYDDDTQVLQNPYILNWHYLGPMFTRTVWSFTGGLKSFSNYYRPLMMLGYLLCHEVFGFRAYGFHLVSIGLNAGVVYLLFIVTRRIFGDRLLAFLAAGLFALHPIHTEAVDWIAAVTDLELTFFFLLSFWFFLRLEDSAGRRAAFLQLGMAVSYALALLSKEPAAALPFLATFFEHACRDDRSGSSWILKLSRYAALWLLLIAYVFWRVRLLGAFVPTPQRPHLPSNATFLTGIALAGEYLEKMIWPAHLCAVYVFPEDIASLLPAFCAGAAAILVSALLMIYFWKRERRVCFGFVWFFVTLAPVLNARWMPAVVFSERYLYLPSAGLCWVGAWAGVRAWDAASRGRRRSRQTLLAGACALGALLAARIVTRNPDWKDDLTFYNSTLAASPDSAIIQNNLGIYYEQRGDLKAAAAHWDKAMEFMPNAPFVLDNMGLLNMRLKRYQDAIGFYEKSLAISSRDEPAHIGLSEVYQDLGLRGRAESESLEAVALAPLNVEAKVHLGQLYYDDGKYAQAKAQFQGAVQFLPTVRGYTGLGLVQWAQGDHAGAIRFFSAAMQLDPKDSRPYVLLGVLYAASGNAAGAIREYQAGLHVDPTNKVARAQLAKLEHGTLTPKPVQPQNRKP